MRATTAIFDVIFVGAGMTSKTVVTKPDVRKSGPSTWTIGSSSACFRGGNPQDCLGGRETPGDSVTLVTE